MGSGITVRWRPDWGHLKTRLGWAPKKASSFTCLLPQMEWLKELNLARWPLPVASLGVLTAWQSQDREFLMCSGFPHSKCFQRPRAQLQGFLWPASSQAASFLLRVIAPKWVTGNSRRGDFSRMWMWEGEIHLEAPLRTNHHQSNLKLKPGKASETQIP